MRSSSTETYLVNDLILDVLGTHRGSWMNVQEIAAVAARVRPSLNERDTRWVELIAPSVVASSSVERRVVWVGFQGGSDRWGNDGGVVWAEMLELRIPW